MHALLPFLMEHPRIAMDRFSMLRDVEKGHQRRHEMVTWCLINICISMKNYLEALTWLNELLRVDGQNQKVTDYGSFCNFVIKLQGWYTVCCIQVILGDVNRAKETKKRITDSNLSAIVSGLCSFCEQDYSSNPTYRCLFSEGFFRCDSFL